MEIHTLLWVNMEISNKFEFNLAVGSSSWTVNNLSNKLLVPVIQFTISSCTYINLLYICNTKLYNGGGKFEKCLSDSKL